MRTNRPDKHALVTSADGIKTTISLPVENEECPETTERKRFVSVFVIGRRAIFCSLPLSKI